LVDAEPAGPPLGGARVAAYADRVTSTLGAPPTVDLPSLLPGTVLAGADDGSRRPRTLRDWIVDVLLFLICVGGGVLLVSQEQDSTVPMSGRQLIFDLGVGALCCLALWWRRRWPLTIAIVATLGSVVSTAAGFAAVAMLFTVAVHRRARISVALAATGTAQWPIYRVLHHNAERGDVWWVDFVVGTLITALALGWGLFTRARRQLLYSLRDRAQRAEAEQQLRLEQARRTERTRIAREMHDVLAHRISLLAVHAGALEFRPDASSEQVAAAAGVIRTSAHQALEELRSVIGVLREDDAGDPAPPPPQPGLAEIPALLAESTGAGVRVGYRCEVTEPEQVPAGMARTVYRVVQEGLTNVRKHAPGSRAEVVLSGDPEHGLDVAVENASPIRVAGEPPGLPGSGLGLIGLAERVQLAGGRLEHGRSVGPPARFTLRAWLPWR
jgi:signal transduction histidine kinase